MKICHLMITFYIHFIVNLLKIISNNSKVVCSLWLWPNVWCKENKLTQELICPRGSLLTMNNICVAHMLQSFS